MAKGVLLGVIGAVTVLPSLILILDKPLQKTKHRSLIPNMEKAAKGIVKVFPLFLIILRFLSHRHITVTAKQTVKSIMIWGNVCRRIFNM